MPEPIHLKFDPPLRFTMQERRAFAEQRLAVGAFDRESVIRLAVLRRDLSDPLGAVELLETRGTGGVEELSLLGSLYADLGGPDHKRKAEAAYRKIEASDAKARLRASALGGLGALQLERGERQAAKSQLAASVGLDPSHHSAIRRHVTLLREDDGPEAALAWLEDQIASGNRRASILAMRSAVLAAAGRDDEARAACGLDRFLQTCMPEPPEGWSSLAAFNRALAEEFRTHPARRGERPRSSAQGGWRVDEPLLRRSRLLPLLEQLIARSAASLLPAVKGAHPLVDARPARAVVRYWATAAQGVGYQAAHMHPAGWMSGVYYVQAPDAVAAGTGEAGCLRFVQPSRICGPGVELAGPWLRPFEGLFAMFPSHAFHETFPYPEEAGDRLCVAFDLEPQGGI